MGQRSIFGVLISFAMVWTGATYAASPYNSCEQMGLSLAAKSLNLNASEVSPFAVSVSSFRTPVGSVIVRFTHPKLVTAINPTGEADCTVPFTNYDGDTCAFSSQLGNSNLCDLYNING